MPAGLKTQSSTRTPTRFATAVRSVVPATDSRRTRPSPSAAPGRTYLSPTTSIAGPPRAAPMAVIATAPASAAARGPPRARATAIGTRPTVIAVNPPHHPHEDTASRPARPIPRLTPRRTARRVPGVGPTRGALLGDVGGEGAGAEARQRAGQLALVPGAVTGDAAWNDLAALRHERAETLHVAVVDGQNLVDAELADLASAEPTPLHGLDHLFASSLLASLPACGAPRSADPQKGTSSAPLAASSTGSGSPGAADPPARPPPRNPRRCATTRPPPAPEPDNARHPPPGLPSCPRP